MELVDDSPHKICFTNISLNLACLWEGNGEGGWLDKIKKNFMFSCSGFGIIKGETMS